MKSNETGLPFFVERKRPSCSCVPFQQRVAVAAVIATVIVVVAVAVVAETASFAAHNTAQTLPAS